VASQKAIPPIVTDVTVVLSVHLAVCHTLAPAKAVGRDEMPFGRDTHVVPSNIVLDTGPGPLMARGDLGVGTPGQNRYN